MKELSKFERFIEWAWSLFYNCDKGRHKWGYLLSESGVVYMEQEDVPRNMWLCLNCKIRKLNFNIKNT